MFPPEGATSTCALLFSCCGRGASFHRKHGVELAAFKEAFPDTPVSGLFVLGEIGHTHLGEGGAADRPAAPLPSRAYNAANHLRHTFSSIILVMAFKQP